MVVLACPCQTAGANLGPHVMRDADLPALSARLAKAQNEASFQRRGPRSPSTSSPDASPNTE
jgi:hypothetical protein